MNQLACAGCDGQLSTGHGYAVYAEFREGIAADGRLFFSAPGPEGIEDGDMDREPPEVVLYCESCANSLFTNKVWEEAKPLRVDMPPGGLNDAAGREARSEVIVYSIALGAKRRRLTPIKARHDARQLAAVWWRYQQSKNTRRTENRGRTGPQKTLIDYRILGILIMLGGIALAIAIVRNTGYTSGVRDILQVAFAGGGSVLWYGIRANHLKYSKADSRPPVLYLRKFSAERCVFARFPSWRAATGAYKVYGKWPWNELSKLNRDTAKEPTFEDFFHEDMGRMIGQLVALGNPEDDVAPNLLARRIYTPDSDWQRQLADISRDARCIVAVPDISEYLGWEFGFLRDQGFQQKLFLLTPPKFSAPTARHARHPASPIPRVYWPEFAARMEANGFLMFQDPGPGAVISFDEASKAVLLRAGALTSLEYIEAMLEWLPSEVCHSEVCHSEVCHSEVCHSEVRHSESKL